VSGGQRSTSASRWTDREIRAADHRHVWHPYTSLDRRNPDNHWPVLRRGEGVWLYDTEDRPYLDACGSWWVSVLGHSHPRVVQHMAEQLACLPHAILAQTLHEPAARLAEALARICPGDLNRVFYTDNGSTAVEVAMRASLQFHAQNGQPQRTIFGHLENSYHGDTLGAASTGGIDAFHGRTGRYGFLARSVPAPIEPTPMSEATNALSQFFEAHGHEMCAFIVEPLIQGAAGMRIYEDAYLKQVRALCDEHGVHLIADEVFTGFGRTHHLFACDKAGIVPDMMCLSKGLSGGALPFGAMVATDEIYAGFDGTTDRALLYGHSYCGNPLGCAAALGVIEAFDEDDVLSRARDLAPAMDQRLDEIRALPDIHRVQRLGGIARWEIGTSGAYGAAIGDRVREIAVRHGLLLRPLGNVVYVVPALTMTSEELHTLFDRTLDVLREACSTP
jgi:adenosylmethionine-8-amino-7-oxononanoate aminotransferase